MTSTTTGPVAVLGLGRMGTAIARRLSARGWEVITWTRSGAALDGLRAAGDPALAVKEARYVLLTLFDAAACREVVDRCGQALGPDHVVVNLSTVSPDEATETDEAVTRSGATYVHAPVIGSTGAVAAGELSILIGWADHPSPAEPLLAALGTTFRVRDPATAAKAKLLANGALGAALLAVGGALSNAAELGLSSELALAVLDRTALAPVARAKRARLTTADTGRADFTLAALVKDLGLLAASTTAGRTLLERVTDEITVRRLALDSDIAALALPVATGRQAADPAGLAAAAARLAQVRVALAPGVAAASDVIEPLIAYARGHATGDPAHFRDAFLPSAHIEGIRDGRFVSWPLDEYCANFSGRPATDESRRARRITQVSVDGTIATATMELWHGPDTFTDIFLLVQTDGGWRIANKVYHRRHAG